MATSLPMLKRPKQSGNRAIFRRGRNVAGTLEVPCPFRVYARKHGFNYPEDYCKEGHTFKGNEKLNEHISRYHTLRYWCPDCKKRFPFNSHEDLTVLKVEHKNSCSVSAPIHENGEWERYIVMSSEQSSRWSDKKWKKSNVRRREGEAMPRYSWRQIYECLFLEAIEFPGSCSREVNVACRVSSPDPAKILPVPPIMKGPVEVRVPEEMARLMLDFADWRIECNVFSQNNNAFSEWYNNMLGTIWHVKCRCASEAVRHVNVLLGQLNAIVKGGGATCFQFLIYVSESFRHDWPEVSKLINNYIGPLLETLLGRRHPVVLIWNRYEELPESLVFFSLTNATKFTLEHLKLRLPPNSAEYEFHLVMYLGTLHWGLGQRVAQTRAANAGLTLSMLTDVTATDNPVALYIICAAQLGAKYYNAAEHTLKLIESNTSKDPCLGMRDPEYYALLALVFERTGRMALAEYQWLEMAKSSLEALGVCYYTADAFEVLSDYYNKVDRDVEAAHWKLKYDEMCERVANAIITDL